MEQRAPGHTVLDDKIYRRGLLDFKQDIAAALARLDFAADPEAWDKREQLVAWTSRAMPCCCSRSVHAALAEERAEAECDPVRRTELRRIAEVCRHVPAHAPRDFHEALQSYWFCHLAVITELNGWDSVQPRPPGPAPAALLRAGARRRQPRPRERQGAPSSASSSSFNNHPAPPKVGVTAAESGTYTDFANINIGGLLADGSDARTRSRTCCSR